MNGNWALKKILCAYLLIISLSGLRASSWHSKSNPLTRSLEDEDLNDQLTLIVQHSLEHGSNVQYEHRGSITIPLSRNGDAVYHQEKTLSHNDITKLKKLAAENEMYHLKIFPKGNDEQAVFTLAKACAIYESGLSDTITVTLDQNGFLVGVGLSALPPYYTGIHIHDSELQMFNTTVNIISVVNAPIPDTLTYIQRMEQEKAEKARGEHGDNRSFFAKYWMYIVPLVIFLLISGASGPESQASGR